MRLTNRVRWFATIAALAAFSACQLNLDKSLIHQQRDGGLESSAGRGGVAGTSGSAGSSGTGGASATGGTGGSDAGTCATTADCKAGGGCVVGRCASGHCLYELCPSATACTARSCDTSSNQCGSAKSYGFLAGNINVGQALGCGNSAQRCIAAIGDYVFVGTENGLSAWRVTNPASPEPVSVVEPPFAIEIQRLVSNNSRLLVLGPLRNGNLSLAWIDLPSDPNASSITTNSQTVAFDPAGYDAVYPADSGAFFFVKNNPLTFSPAVRLSLPVQTGTSVSLYPSTSIPAGSTIVGASGSRLVSYRTDTTASPTAEFSFEQNAGTPSAQNAGETSHPEAGDVPSSLSAHSFASGDDGSLLWVTNHLTRTDGGLEEADAVVFRWPIVGTSTTIKADRQVTLESYSSLFNENAGYAGPAALIDSTTALTTAADPNNPQGSTVHSVQRSGDTLTLGTGHYALPAAVSQIGVAGGSTFGYVLLPSTAAPPATPNPTVDIFAPGCG